jgi:hypothetical protein
LQGSLLLHCEEVAAPIRFGRSADDCCPQSRLPRSLTDIVGSHVYAVDTGRNAAFVCFPVVSCSFGRAPNV